jgi:hypothetical protein
MVDEHILITTSFKYLYKNGFFFFKLLLVMCEFWIAGYQGVIPHCIIFPKSNIILS